MNKIEKSICSESKKNDSLLDGLSKFSVTEKKMEKFFDFNKFHRESLHSIYIADNDNKLVVSAVDLISYFECYEGGGRVFDKWFRNIVNKYSFIEGLDFVEYWRSCNTSGTNFTDYAVSIDMAKFMAILDRSLEGRDVYRFLVEQEEIFRSQKPTSNLKVLQLYINNLVKQEEQECLSGSITEKSNAEKHGKTHSHWD